MKRHLTLASGDRLATSAHRVHIAEPSGRGRPVGTLVWKHTLILEGRLDEASRLELEDEVECLYQEGVTSLRLDLSRLHDLDAAGLETLASVGARCRQRGQDVAVIPGSPVIGSALADAGARDLLASEAPEPALADGFALHGPMRIRSTTTVKGLM
jgi:anti-anti-sigma regulatory factor